MNASHKNRLYSHHLRSLIVLTLCWSGCTCGPAEDEHDAASAERTVRDLYIESHARPGLFDQYVASHRSEVDTPEVRTCLATIQEELLDAADDHDANCKKLVDPEWVGACRSENDPAHFIGWARAISHVLDGRVLWSETDRGSLAILGQHLTDGELGTGYWESTVEESSRRFAGIIQLYLSC